MTGHVARAVALVLVGLGLAFALVLIVGWSVLSVQADPIAAWRAPSPSLTLPAGLLIASAVLLLLGGLLWVSDRDDRGLGLRIVVAVAVGAWLVAGVVGIGMLGRDVIVAGTGHVEGLPGQTTSWSGPIECRRYTWGSFGATGRSAEAQVPASATGSTVAFDLVLADLHDADVRLIVGDARWGPSTGSVIFPVSTTISDGGLRGTVLTEEASILSRDDPASVVTFSWDCRGPQ